MWSNSDLNRSINEEFSIHREHFVETNNVENNFICLGIRELLFNSTSYTPSNVLPVENKNKAQFKAGDQ